MANTFDTEYGVTPWENFETNQRTVYVPELLETFRNQALFYRLVTYGVNLAAQRTQQMVFTRPIDPEPNIQSSDFRATWLPQLYMDSQSITITTARYGNKIQLHKWDDLITYWTENGREGLRAIMRSRVAPNMIQTLDILARNAFLEHYAPMFAGGRSDFRSITSSDTFDPDIVDAIWLSVDYAPDPVTSPIFGICSPGAQFVFQNTAMASGDWLQRLQYADPQRLINYEIGAWKNVRFAVNPLSVLWNCGEVIHQTFITAPVERGDGAPDPSVSADNVDGVWATGQPGATHGITVNDANGFVVGDWVTLHRVRNSSNSTRGVLNGVVYDHYQNTLRRIVKKSGSTVYFNKPILTDWFSTTVNGQSHYGWMTKARNINTAIFVKGPRAVVAGVTQPPQTYTPPPVDDTESVYRFSWDAYLKYQIMFPERFEVLFHAGPHRRLGEVVNL